MTPSWAPRGIQLNRRLVNGAPNIFRPRGNPGPILADGTVRRLNWQAFGRAMRETFTDGHPLSEMMTHTGPRDGGGHRIFNGAIAGHRSGDTVWALPITVAAHEAGLGQAILRLWDARQQTRTRRRAAEGSSRGRR